MRQVLVVDSHPLVVLGLKSLLSSHFSSIEITVSQNFEDTLSILSGKTFDLLVMELGISGDCSCNIVRSVKELQSSLPILICSDCDQQMYAIPAFKAGASGFISKNASKEEIRFALDLVINNRIYMSPVLYETTINQLSVQNKESLTTDLSEREHGIATMLIKGFSIKAISRSFNISSPAVSNNKQRIFRKLKVSNVIELSSLMSEEI